MNVFGKDVAVSLVDDSFIFSTQTQASPLVLPAYVAIQTGTTRGLACGEDAKAMMGRAPSGISVIRVLAEGVVADQDAAVLLFRFGLRKLLGRAVLVRPRVLIAVRTHEPGKYSARNMATEGGAREVYQIEMGLATAVGMQLDVSQPELKAVLSVSDDWFEFAVISLAGRLCGTNGAIGSRALVEDIQNHLTLRRQFRPEFAVLASQLQSGGVNPRAVIDLPGWETWSGRTEQGRFTAQNTSRDELTVGMMPSLVRLTERLKAAIRSLPDEKQAQLTRTTIHATGTAMQIPGLAQLIAQQLGHSITPFSAKNHPSIEGCRTVLKELNILKRANVTGR
jgi:rod shape-determining protein MreB